MKQLIKSCTLYRAEAPSATDMENTLSEVGFAELLSTQQLSIGFVPRVEHGHYTELFPGGFTFTVRIDQKVVPSALVKSEADKLAKAVEADTGRKPGKKERKELKLQALDSLLATTPGMTTNMVTCFWHNPSGLLIIPSTSKRLCDRIVSALIAAVGTLKLTTIHVNVKQGLTKRLQDWLDGDLEAFDALEPVDSVVLDLDKLRVSMRVTTLDSAREGLKEALSRGFKVKSLGFESESGTEMRLSDDFRFSSLAFSFELPPEDLEQLFQAQAALEVSEVVGFAEYLCTMFGFDEEAQG